MFEGIKIKALESKIRSLEKELKNALYKMDVMKSNLEFLDATKTTKSERMEANFLYEDIGTLAEEIKVLRVKIAFGKEKLKNLKNVKYFDIDTDLNL